MLSLSLSLCANFSLFSPPFCLCLSAPQRIFLFSSGPPVHITQIKAQRGEDTWSIFVRPPRPIETPASEVSGITLADDQMYFRGQPVVESVTIPEALNRFFQFLGDQPVVIFGHNISRYGGHHLLREAIHSQMIAELLAHVHGYVDTWSLFRSIAPDLPSHTFRALCERYLPSAEQYNDGVPTSGARALQRIVAEAHIPERTILQHFYSF